MTTRSKLGGQYPTARIQAADKQSHATLKRLRGLAGNRECAECRASPTTWASVSLGVFVCMDCAQVHRNLGTHISKVPAHRVPGAVGGEEASDLLLSPQS